MLEYLFQIYSYLFSRKLFYRANYLLYHLSLRGMGILNYHSMRSSGEEVFLKKFVTKENAVVFDVGAHSGEYSLCVHSINPSAHIFAFEPHPTSFAALQKNTRSANIKCVNAGLGKSITELRLYDYQNNDGSQHASIHQKVIEQIHHSPAVSHEIKIQTIDTFTKEQHISHIDLLKIDTEGNEYDVLLGATDTLASGCIAIIQFEFSHINLVAKTTLRDFIDLLPNYEFFRILRQGLLPLTPYNQNKSEIFYFQNIVAIHKESLRGEAL